MILRRIATFAFIFAIVGLAIGLSSCERIASIVPEDEMPPTEEMMPIEITIGVAVALTGDNAEPYGLPMRRGLELAQEEINMLGDLNIMFVFEDPKSTIDGAKMAVQNLVDQSVPAIIGIGISTHLEQAFPIANAGKVIAFSPISSAAGLSALGDYIFRAGIATNILIPGGVMKTQMALEYKNAALIYDDDDTYSTSSNTEVKKALEASGVAILTEQTFKTGDTDFTTQLTEIMNLDPQPDVLFIAALSKEMTQIIVKAREIGIPDTVRFIVPDLTDAEVQKSDGAAEGAIAFAGWSALTDTPANQAFVQSYRTKYDIEPLPWAAQAYATLYILAEAIKNAAPSTDATAIRDALAQTMSLPTILGDFSFDPNGEAIYENIETIVLSAKDGKLQDFGGE